MFSLFFFSYSVICLCVVSLYYISAEEVKEVEESKPATDVARSTIRERLKSRLAKAKVIQQYFLLFILNTTLYIFHSLL